jgi:hypothetical protein
MILRSAVPYRRTAFDRLLEPLDHRMVARAVAAPAGDRGVGGGARAWTCERHLKSLLFAQWAGLTRLREAAGAQPAVLPPQPARTLSLDPGRGQCRAAGGDVPRHRNGADPGRGQSAAAGERGADPVARRDPDPTQRSTTCSNAGRRLPGFLTTAASACRTTPPNAPCAALPWAENHGCLRVPTAADSAPQQCTA